MPSKEAKAYRATLIAIISAVILLSLKAVVGVLIYSLSVVADAFDSLLDLLVSILMFFFLKHAALPPDEEHPFGHGKYDAVASLFQATIMVGFAGILCTEAMNKILHNLPVRLPEFGIGVILLNIVFKVMLIKYLFQIYKETGYLSLFSLVGNFKGDLYNSLGIIFALSVAKGLGIHIFDPLIAILIAGFFVKTAVIIYREAFHQILDKAPREIQRRVERLLTEHYPNIVGFHKLRVRRAGNSLQMDMHILLPNGLSLEEAHDLSEHLEKDIRDIFPLAVVVIHMEPEKKDVQGDLESKEAEHRESKGVS